MQLTVFFVACLLGVALGKKNGPGQMCTRCNKARDTEEACNNQDIEGGNEKQCKDNQVCTTDVRCDGQGRLYFIKGCEKAAKITAANTLICNDDFTRCNYHCDQGDFCNLNAPPAVWESLVCYSTPTTAPTTTPEPPTTPDALPCECTVRGDPLVNTYDNQLVLITSEQKTLLSRWDVDPVDPCKFQSRLQTDDDAGSVAIDWVAFSFGIHTKKNTKFHRALQFGCVRREIRGQGFDGPDPLDLTVQPYEYNQAGTHVSVVDDNGTIKLRSNTCQWELDFTCQGDDGLPHIRLAVGAKYQDQNMRGICADCDGVTDDFRNCFTLEDYSGVEPPAAKYSLISDSCVDGAHQHQD